MKRIAYLCPGQGAQHVGMGRELVAEFRGAGAVFAEADDALGFSLSRLCFEGPQDELTLTTNAQPALLTASVAIARILAAEGGIRPQIAAGHSLGEWSALVIAGALELAPAIVAVRERGRLMQAAVPPGLGAMAALLGCDVETVETLCRAASRGTYDVSGGSSAAAEAPLEVVVPANLNGAGQVVVAGHLGAVERLEALAAERRIRAVRLNVSAPFHSPLMAPAREAMRPVLAKLDIKHLEIPVLSNVDARPHGDPARVRELLLEQITAPVRWEDCARAVASEAEVAIEVGPGKVLSGLMRRLAPGVTSVATGDVAGVRAALAAAGS
jgi:[acyl-carrier-protein] S-malonyltransferase